MRQCIQILDRQRSHTCEKCEIQKAVRSMLASRDISRQWTPVDECTLGVNTILHHLDIKSSTTGVCKQPHDYMAIHDADSHHCLFITERPKIGMALIKCIFHFCKQMHYTSTLLVTKYKVTSFAQQSATELANSSGVSIKFISWHDVFFNPLHHQLSPNYKVVTKAYILHKNPQIGAIRLTELPKIRLTDPVVQYMGMCVGQILSITRSDGEESFRVVVR